MLIHVEVCDHCGTPARGKSFESYKLVGNDTVYHICSVCQDRPFRILVTPHPRALAVQETVRLMLGM